MVVITVPTGYGDSNALALARLNDTNVDLGIISMLRVRIRVKLNCLGRVILDRQRRSGFDGDSRRAETTVRVGYRVVAAGRG